MATIKDGMKIAFGWLLFKWIIGMASCAATIGAITCLVNSANPAKETSKAVKANRVSIPEQNVSNPSQPPDEIVRYAKGCNLRKEPKNKSTIVGFAEAGKSYNPIERKGAWRRLRLDDGVEGWAGCLAAAP